MEKLEECSELAITWLKKAYMKSNTDICHLIVSGTKYENVWIKIGTDKIWESSNVKLLGVNIVNEFKFDEHFSNKCFKANRKLSALTRLSQFLSLEKQYTLFNTLIESQFKYCLLVWMFHRTQANHKINRLHEITLRIVYNNYVASFQDLLNEDNSLTIHQQEPCFV